jgi:hypothetical protein
VARNDPRIALLVDVLDRTYRRNGWHGTTLRGAFRGMTPRQALWRPAPGANCAWNLLLHAAYWKYVVRRRIAEEEPDGFRRSPADWPALPRPADARALRADLRLLDDEHRLLVAAVRRLRPRDLDRRTPKRAFTWAQVIHGVAAHDAHHGGQVQVLKRLRGARGRGR